MSKGLLFWILMILWVLSVFFGGHLFGPHGI